MKNPNEKDGKAMQTGNSQGKKADIVIFQAPYASLVEQGLYLKMHDSSKPFSEVVPAEYYMPVFSGEIDCPEDLPDEPAERTGAILETVFNIFNTRRPAGYCGRSLSVGDVVKLEGKYYLCAVVGFTPVEFETSKERRLPEEGQSCRLTLPSGITLRATVDQDTEYPGITISMIDSDGKEAQVCFVEHNPEKAPGQQLCIGAYCDAKDDVVYYSSYYESEE